MAIRIFGSVILTTKELTKIYDEGFKTGIKIGKIIQNFEKSFKKIKSNR